MPDNNRQIPRVGVSSCLLGESVRWDGGHKLDPLIRDTLGELFDFVPLCPEVECGMPVPREPMHLEQHADGLVLIGVNTHTDYTTQMQRWIDNQMQRPGMSGLCGFILKSKSPSCGLRGLQIYHDSGVASGTSMGIWTQALRRSFPNIPLVDEIDLQDSAQREQFIEQVQIYQLNVQ
jgi:uncharacterized protein YbbK (DUF523 family)